MKQTFLSAQFNTGTFGRVLSNPFFWAKHDDISTLIGGLSTKLDSVLNASGTAETTAKAADNTAKAAQVTAAAAQKTAETAVETVNLIKASNAEAKIAADANQKALDGLLVEVKTLREGGMKMQGPLGDFKQEFAQLMAKNHDMIKGVSRGQKWATQMSGGAEMIRKAASVMTTATDLTGSPVVTFLPQPVLLPGQKINVRDLVSTFQSSTLTINLFRESSPTPAQGGFGQQLTEGAIKPMVEYNYGNVAFTASYTSGFVRFAKQMLYNLPWLQTALPQQLIRDFYIKENAIFFASLASAATGPTATVDTVTGLGTASYAARLIQVIAGLEGTNFTANGIIVSPNVWASLMLTTLPSFGGASPLGTSYSIPGGVMIAADGKMMIAGIPIIKANWISSPMAMVADWEFATIAQVENLKIEFFEQDSDNVEKNLITARCEALEVLVVEQPLAFCYKNLNSAN